MKNTYKIISSLLVFAMVFSLAIAIGTTSVKADDSDFKIDAAGTLVKYSGEGNVVEIPKSVKAIGEKAFWSCKNISIVKMPNSVKSIGKSAFESCTGLTKIEFSNKLETIDETAFFGCSSLNKVNLPNSLKNIGFSAFTNCRELNGIYIPKNVEEIGSYAFGYNVIGGYTQTPDFVVIGEGAARMYADKYGFPNISEKSLAVKPVSLKKYNKSQANLSWKKNDKVEKYQIQVSASKNFSKKTSYTVDNAEVTSRYLTKLKKGTTYYVRIRGARNIAGTTYTSKWSKVKTVKM